MKQHPLKHQIEAERYLNSKQAAGQALGTAEDEGAIDSERRSEQKRRLESVRRSLG